MRTSSTYLARGAIAACGLALALAPTARAQAPAPTPYYIHFETTSSIAVDNIAIYNSDTNDGGYYGFATSYSVPVGVSDLTDGFQKIYPPVSNFLVGTALEPGDVASSELIGPDITAADLGVVFFANPTFADTNIGKSFESVFPDVSESNLISWLQDPNDNVNNLFNFGNEYGAEIGFNPGDPLNNGFEEIQFSDGKIVGSGVSDIVPAIAAVPEPSMWALMIIGLGGLGMALRQAKRSPSLRAKGVLAT